MEQQEAKLHDGANHGTADAAARFLRELRQLRDIAGLGQAELAARAHYPRNVIELAESGPSLPDLPVLSAYVRGCGGTADDVAAWEDRWRLVTGAKASPLLPAREAGHSDAADAGARIGAISAAADSHDPAAIMAALDRYAETMATDLPPRPAGGPGTSGSPAGGPGSPAGGPGSLAGAGASNGFKDGNAKATSPRLTGAVPGMRAPSGSPTPPGATTPPVQPSASAPTVPSATSVPQDPREPVDEITADLVAAMAETPVFGESTAASRWRAHGAGSSGDGVPGPAARIRQLPGGFGFAVGIGVVVVLLVVLLLIVA